MLCGESSLSTHYIDEVLTFIRPILELKREVTDEEYATLRQFPDLADSEALQKFEEFIGSLASPKVKGKSADFRTAKPLPD